MFFLRIHQKYLNITQSPSKKMFKSYLIGVTLLCVILSTYAKDDKKENYGTVIGIDLGTTYSW